MNKNIRILIAFVIEALVVALLVAASQILATNQRKNTPPETYVYKNIYFEYPGNWEVSLNETTQGGELGVTPLPGSPEAKMFGTFYITFLPDLVLEDWEQTIADQQNCSGHTNTLWYRLMDNEDFSGFECAWKQPEDKFPHWQLFLYNESGQIGFSILATPFNDAGAEAINSLEAAQGAFPDILRIAGSVRISEK